MRWKIQSCLACLACVCMVGLNAQTASAADSGSWNGNNGSTAWDGANFIDNSLIDVDPLNPLPSLGAGADLEPHIMIVDGFAPGGAANPGGFANTLFPIIPAGQDAVAARLFMGVVGLVGTASITVEGKLTANTGGTSTLGRDIGGVSILNIDGGDLLLASAQVKAGELNINVTNGGQLRFGEIFAGIFAATGDLRPKKTGALNNGTSADDITGTLTIDDSLVEMKRLRIDLSEAAAIASGGVLTPASTPLSGTMIHQFMVDIVGSGSLVVNDDNQATSYLPGSGEEYSLYEMANVDGLIKGNGVPGNVIFTPTFLSDGVTVDFVTITAVPEPASLALLGLGVLGIVAMRNRAARLR